MRYRTFLLTSLLGWCIFAMVLPAAADYGYNAYALHSVIISGYVESFADQAATIRTDDGGSVDVELGPEAYWDSHRYWLTEGQYVEMLVWYDPTGRYTERYFAGEIWGPGIHYVLTNEEGVPYWVVDADDYYYSLGYRASCISYMFWYDCPPVYFVYLILPPPPPVTYFCYYGPRWRNYHQDWHFGPRFRHDGPYWTDGDGYERPHNRPGNHDYEPPDQRPGERDHRGPRQIGGDLTQRIDPPDYRPVVERPVKQVTPPTQTQSPRVIPGRTLPNKYQPAMNPGMVLPQKSSPPRRDVTVTAPAPRVFVPKDTPQPQPVQRQVRPQVNDGGGTSRIAPQPSHDKPEPKDRQASPTPASKSPIGGRDR